jgi:tetratricopeptide (TPR) repeat protein
MSTGAKPRTPAFSPSQRKFLLRDSFVFLALTCVSLLLYGVTLALFRSFEQHRTDLAIYWSDRGQDELSHGNADQAADSLRNAISFAPDNRQYESLLAQALSESGRADQAMSYFLNLWETQPGDGFINLELARLSRSKGLSHQAVNYYHASIFGDWRGDGPARRRAVRLELADYLTSIHDLAAARAELLIASGNASNDADVNMVLGNKFAANGDATDALNSYKKALEGNPRDPAALETAGRVALQLGDYDAGYTFLDTDLKEGIQDSSRREQVMALADEARRLEELALSPSLPNHERAEHLHLGKAIAQARFDTCSAQPGVATQQPVGLVDLRLRWKAAASVSLRTLVNDEAAQRSLSSLIGDTEVFAARVCGAPSGDDALLLRLTSQGVSNH